MTSGTKAPVAISPLILCSMVSATSRGFFSSLGAAMPTVSLRKQAVTNRGRESKTRLRKPGQSSALLRSLGVKIPPRADRADAQQRGDGNACDLRNFMSQVRARRGGVSGRPGCYGGNRPGCGRAPTTGGQGSHSGQQDETSHTREPPPSSEVCKAAHLRPGRLTAVRTK